MIRIRRSMSIVLHSMYADADYYSHLQNTKPIPKKKIQVGLQTFNLPRTMMGRPSHTKGTKGSSLANVLAKCQILNTLGSVSDQWDTFGRLAKS